MPQLLRLIKLLVTIVLFLIRTVLKTVVFAGTLIVSLFNPVLGLLILRTSRPSGRHNHRKYTGSSGDPVRQLPT